MKFKESVLADQFNDKKLHPTIRATVNLLDSVIALYVHSHPNATVKDLVITSLYRPGNPKSYHSKWQAVDLRTFDWDLTVQRRISTFLHAVNSLTRHRVQFEFEPNDRHPDSDPHLHIEYDDGSLGGKATK